MSLNKNTEERYENDENTLDGVLVVSMMLGCATGAVRSAGDTEFVIVESTVAEDTSLFGFWIFNGSPSNEIPGGPQLMSGHAPRGGHFVDDEIVEPFFANSKYIISETHLVREFDPARHPHWADGPQTQARSIEFRHILNCNHIDLGDLNQDLFSITMELAVSPFEGRVVDDEGNEIGKQFRILSMGYVGHSFHVIALQAEPKGPFHLAFQLRGADGETQMCATGIELTPRTSTELYFTLDNYQGVITTVVGGAEASVRFDRVEEWARCPSGGIRNKQLRLAPWHDVSFNWFAVMNGQRSVQEIQSIKQEYLRS